MPFINTINNWRNLKILPQKFIKKKLKIIHGCNFLWIIQLFYIWSIVVFPALQIKYVDHAKAKLKGYYILLFPDYKEIESMAGMTNDDQQSLPVSPSPSTVASLVEVRNKIPIIKKTYAQSKIKSKIPAILSRSTAYEKAVERQHIERVCNAQVIKLILFSKYNKSVLSSKYIYIF